MASNNLLTKTPAWTSFEKKDAITVQDYLALSQIVARLFDAMGTLALLYVKKDISTNIKSIQDVAASSPPTLVGFLAKEEAAGRGPTYQPKYCPLKSYVWLKRTLELVCETFHQWLTTQNELPACMKAAYELTLSPHHYPMERNAFGMALSYAPTRDYFHKRIGKPSDAEIAAFYDGLKRALAVFPHYTHVTRG